MLHYIFNLSFLVAGINGQILNIGVGVNGNKFTPSSVNAVVGTVVVFNWISGSHDVTQTSSDSCTNITPGGFTSGPAVDQPGKKFNVTITKQGNIWYACQVHCAIGMKGVIIVGSGNSTTPSAPFTSISPPTLSPTSNGDGDAEDMATVVGAYCLGVVSVLFAILLI
jgi:plastocyanin